MTEKEKPPAGNRGRMNAEAGNRVQIFERGVKSIGVSARIGKPPKSGGLRGKSRAGQRIVGVASVSSCLNIALPALFTVSR